MGMDTTNKTKHPHMMRIKRLLISIQILLPIRLRSKPNEPSD
jgi:hypothetical protein